MSTTVAKALTLLDQFSEDTPEVGLSDLARRTGLDKATVHRMMSVLADAGLVEQRGAARLYRLGPGVLRLARVREKSFPVTAIFQPALDSLASKTGETAHASLISGRALATIDVCESNRSSRVSLVAGEVLPFHTTASGMAALAFAYPELRERTLSSSLSAKTAHTVTDVKLLRQRLEEVAASGFAESDQGNEEDVYGIAVPVFYADGFASGSIAVATPAHRMTPDLRQTIICALIREAEKVTFNVGGTVPASYRNAAARSLASFAKMPG
ncbi:IclR family transcriptional regulator [Defluviimonas sp. WL0002]|uniref:IclR family transcriptional regulator n=1 Tax=Albidovulum marisflavi TaxID=2984159 RepID=A0ABT2ZDT7_9RHOB|nr:IclR family transcriptional regulator [Defluviimonas sp. WL0002]MCV2869279.1 IclR family transcriptional regulator [Defluviimonas sp. WL0002]